jgi:hypothetical protein
MTETLALDAEHALRYRATPWDARVFGCPTAELVEIKYRDPARIRELLAAYDRLNADAGVRLVVTRIDANDRALKEELARGEFRYVETSLVMANDAIARHAFEKRFNRTVPLGAAESAEDMEQIRCIARDGFEYSRFHEDVRIDRGHARERYYRWIDDLVAQGKKILVYKAGGRVAAFMAYESRDGEVDLVLGGAARERGVVAPYFWASVLARLRDEGHRSAIARISAANVRVLRLYISLFFNVRSVDLGFTKLYR